MRILEILLPKSLDDHSISPKHIQRIDTLQKRMDAYVDKICDPKTSAQGKEFLKSRLRDDYHELKDTIAHVHKIAEDGLPPVEPIESFEVVDSRTGKVMGKPYNSRSRARSRADKLDNEYGAYRYKVRRVGSSFMIEEPSYELDTDSMDNKKKIEKYLAFLSPRDKKVLELRFIDGLNSEEVAKEMGISAQVVRQSESRGLQTIKTQQYIQSQSNPGSDDEVTDIRGRIPSQLPGVYYEIYDTHTGKIVPKMGPYAMQGKASNNTVFLNRKAGEDRYSFRIVGTSKSLREAVHKLPLTSEDFDLVQELMSRPIPAAVAPIYIQEIIDDDEFNSMLNEFAEINPNMDVRPHVVEWIKRVMPDQMYRFDDSAQTLKQRMGQTSVIHGYDPHMYHGSNEPITGNAYGRR
jgi:RNA polymerase sigma factor (sigma-70 family)